jgi:hypothetical protein
MRALLATFLLFSACGNETPPLTCADIGDCEACTCGDIAGVIVCQDGTPTCYCGWDACQPE